MLDERTSTPKPLADAEVQERAAATHAVEAVALDEALDDLCEAILANLSSPPKKGRDETCSE